LKLQQLLEDRFGLVPAADLPADADAGIERILSRRTHRRFSNRHVDDAQIDLLLLVAMSASSKSDFQQASVIKVTDKAKRAAIAQHFPSMPWIGTSPVFLVFCADPNRLERIGTLRNHPEPQRNLEAFLNSAVDAALALQTFILAAEAAGLGCCPISVIRNRLPAVAEVLRLPPGVFPVAGLCVGYPDGPGHLSLRLPPALTIHTDEYSEGDFEAQIDAYDRRRAARHAVSREQQRNPSRFGNAHFYGWSEDKARQAAEPEGQQFDSHLRDTGFRF
jgi:nitroreductase